MDDAVGQTAMAGVLELTQVLELSMDGLDQGPFAEQTCIQEREHAGVPRLLELGEELPSWVPKLREQGLGEGAAIANEFAAQTAGKLRDGRAVIDGARSKPAGQQGPAVVNDQRDCEALDPARAGDSALGSVLENLRRFEAQVMTDF